MASLFNFVEKEGKFFAPIANTVPNYIVQNGAVVESGTRIVHGVKGTYAQVRIELPVANATTKNELFAVNTEVVPSSR